MTYEYDVRGDRYRGDRIAFGLPVGSGDDAQAQAVADRYITGNQIRVYYNPNNPGEAVLERTTPSTSTTRWTVIFILLMLCITTVPLILGMGGVFFILDQFLKGLPFK